MVIMTTVTIPKKIVQKGDLVALNKDTFNNLRKENEELKLAL